MKKQKRLVDIDLLKGLAIMLVVLGHLAPGEPATLPGAEWYSDLKEVIYTFHMPFFMWISGFVAVYSYKEIRNIKAYSDYVTGKATRLLPGFLLVAIAVLAGKYVSQQFFDVDNPLDIWTWSAPLFYPTESYVKFIWYIYVLFEFYVVLPIIIYITRGHLLFALLGSMLLLFIPFPKIFALHFFHFFIFFFLLGGVTAQHAESYLRIVKRFGAILLLVFIVSLLLIQYVEFPFDKRLVMGVLSIPALHYMVIKSPCYVKNLLLAISGYVYIIYLLNLPFAGGLKSILFGIFGFGYSDFVFLAPLLFLFGLIMPIIVKKYILSRNGYLDRWTN